MKLLPRIFTLACLLGAPLVHAADQPAGPAASEPKIADIDTAGEIKAMPVSRATVVESGPCYCVLRAEGKTFTIGSPAATQDVVKFLETLKSGQAYEFPKVFLDYQKTTPTFETAGQIKAMPVCKATVEHVGVRDSRLITTDGKMFFIGSSAATEEVVQFVQTLKHQQTYEFPGVFLDFQKAR